MNGRLKGPSKGRFDQIFNDGKRAAGAFCRICSLPGSGLIGFATAKKIGNRPRRNRVRRRFQAAMRELPRGQALDLVIIISAAAEGVELPMVKEELSTLLQKVEARWENESECS